MFAVTGDLDYLAKTLLLPRWSRNTNLCTLCRCTKNGLTSYLDNRYPDAGWLATLWQPVDWKKWPEKSSCTLFQLHWLSAANVYYDWMHIKHLGNDQYVFGSTLYYLCFCILPGSPAENLKILWQWILRYYKKHKIIKNRYRALNKLTMFVKKKSYPKLRGKAVEIKNFGPVIVQVWKHFCNKKDKTHRMITALLETSAELDDILARYPTKAGYFALPEAAGDEFIEKCFLVGQLQKQLNEHFKAAAIKIFNLTAKNHCMMHAALVSKLVHPGLVWCYQGEDFMKAVKRLVMSCVVGNNAFQAMSKATIHYNLAQHLQYEEEARR